MILATASADSRHCSRIISLSPSITEILQALHLETRIVGVSSSDAIRDIPVVGDLFGVNSEAVIGVKPSIVFLLTEQRTPRKRIQALRIPELTVDHRTVEGIRESILSIASFCDKNEQGAEILQELLAKVEAQKKRAAVMLQKSSPPRVLIVIGGGGATQSVKRLFVSGKDGFYFPLLQSIGIEPAFRGETRGVSAMSFEAVLALQPTHILHIIPPNGKLYPTEYYQSLWKQFPKLEAVEKGQVYARQEGFFSIPSIEYPQVLEAFVDMFLQGSNEQQ